MADGASPCYRKVFFRNRFPQDGAQIFEEHNALCKALVPADQLLVFQVSEGWGPLCAFLGVPEPVRSSAVTYGVFFRGLWYDSRMGHSLLRTRARS